MKYKVGDLVSFIEKKFPVCNAMEYDNVGLLTGNRDALVDSVVISLDVTPEAIEICKKNSAQVLITHHPVIFGGINNVSYDDAKGRLITDLIKNDISCIACHTNLDMTDEFGNLCIAEALEAKNPVHLEGCGCGVVFDTDKVDTVQGYALKVKNALNASGVITINNPSAKVTKVFVQGGAFDEESIGAIIDSKVDLVVSGEIKHHICVLLDEYKVSTLIAGHNATERIYLPKLKALLKEEFERLDIFVDFGNERSF